MNSTRSRSAVLLLLLFLLPLLPCQATAPQAAARRNVIVFMMDGTSATATTLARWMKGAPLNLDRMSLGAVRTWNAQSVITDSAPAATAFATGHKTSDRVVGVGPDKVTMPGVPTPAPDDRTRPVASVLEAARLAGLSCTL